MGPISGSTAASFPATSASSGPQFGTDREVTFKVGGLVVHGSLRVPPSPSRSIPGALLLAGSGPTDRNGNSALETVRVNTLAALADILAADGVASLRYDKLGTGTTGLGPFSGPSNAITYQAYLDEATAGLTELADTNGIDKTKLLIVGHSEGALIASSITSHPPAGQPAVVGVALLEPAGSRYLDLLGGQISAGLPGLVQAGKLTQIQSDRAAAALPQLIESIRRTGTIPPGTPLVLQQLGLSGSAAKFLQQADTVDPAESARQIVATDRVALLTTCSTQDTQVPCNQAAKIDAAAAGPHLTAVTLTDAIHTLNPVPTTTPAPGSSLPFSRELPPQLTQWIQSTTS